MSTNALINKESIELYLKELAKKLKQKTKNKSVCEVIIVGGASVVINYGFRLSTTDVDVYASNISVLKECVNEIADSYGLPNDWLNSDFVQSKSFSEKIREYSTYYKLFSNILEVRTLKGEYLIAMKLKSFRNYKKDISDIIGIYNEEKKKNPSFNKNRIIKAFSKLYDDNNEMTDGAKELLELLDKESNFEKLYNLKVNVENENRNNLKIFDKKYPNTLSENNIDKILKK